MAGTGEGEGSGEKRTRPQNLEAVPRRPRLCGSYLPLSKTQIIKRPIRFNLCSSVGLCGITLLALRLETELSLKLLHESCGLRLMPDVRQQCSKSHSQHQHSEQQQNIRRGTHNRHGIAAKLLLFSDHSNLF